MTSSGRRTIKGGDEELPREMDGELFDIGFPDEVLKAYLKLE
jgi:hypothetical protein